MGALIERRKSLHPATRFCARNVVVNGLRFFWVILVIWYELGTYFYSLSDCRWPDSEIVTSHRKPAHVLIITDPQVHNPTRAASDRGWRSSVNSFFFDLNLKKNWYVARRLNPHAIVFLGDMLASGKTVRSDSEYRLYHNKFDRIFQDENTAMFYLPGNNDIGLGLPLSQMKPVRRRYEEHFGAFNREISVHNHTFMLIDAPGLVEEDYQRSSAGASYEAWTPIPGGTVEFIKYSQAGKDGEHVLLFSHMPLARPEKASCGPLRERGKIRKGVGRGYQSTFDKQTTAFLLETLRPVAVFSGDDRDYCVYTHSISPANPEVSANRTQVKEVTVKSFSMAKHIRRPGFQLLSLGSPQPQVNPPPKTVADRPCFLPDQPRIFQFVYPFYAVLSLVVLFISNFYRMRYTPHVAPIHVDPPSISNSPVALHSHAKSPSLRSPTLSNSAASAVWSPFSPMIPISPHSTMPSVMRTPSGPAGPTLRAFSRPATPSGSPLLSPMVFPHEGDEEDGEEAGVMYPMVGRDKRASWGGGSNSSWGGEYQRAYGNGYNKEEGGERGMMSRSHSRSNSTANTLFLPAPVSRPSKEKERNGWVWSWSFVFRGRRRRMTIRIPGSQAISGAANVVLKTLDNGGKGEGKHKKSSLGGTVRDAAGVAWVGVLMWVLMVWCMY